MKNNKVIRSFVYTILATEVVLSGENKAKMRFFVTFSYSFIFICLWIILENFMYFCKIKKTNKIVDLESNNYFEL